MINSTVYVYISYFNRSTDVYRTQPKDMTIFVLWSNWISTCLRMNWSDKKYIREIEQKPVDTKDEPVKYVRTHFNTYLIIYYLDRYDVSSCQIVSTFHVQIRSIFFVHKSLSTCYFEHWINYDLFRFLEQSHQRSATELLDESKAFFVKSQEVLHKRQSLIADTKINEQKVIPSVFRMP